MGLHLHDLKFGKRFLDVSLKAQIKDFLKKIRLHQILKPVLQRTPSSHRTGEDVGKPCVCSVYCPRHTKNPDDPTTTKRETAQWKMVRGPEQTFPRRKPANGDRGPGAPRSASAGETRSNPQRARPLPPRPAQDRAKASDRRW